MRPSVAGLEYESSDKGSVIRQESAQKPAKPAVPAVTASEERANQLADELVSEIEAERCAHEQRRKRKTEKRMPAKRSVSQQPMAQLHAETTTVAAEAEAVASAERVEDAVATPRAPEVTTYLPTTSTACNAPSARLATPQTEPGGGRFGMLVPITSPFKFASAYSPETLSATQWTLDLSTAYVSSPSASPLSPSRTAMSEIPCPWPLSLDLSTAYTQMRSLSIDSSVVCSTDRVSADVAPVLCGSTTRPRGGRGGRGGRGCRQTTVGEQAQVPSDIGGASSSTLCTPPSSSGTFHAPSSGSGTSHLVPTNSLLNVTTPPRASTTAERLRPSPSREIECSICFDGASTHAFIPCGHRYRRSERIEADCSSRPPQFPTRICPF